MQKLSVILALTILPLIVLAKPIYVGDMLTYDVYTWHKSALLMALAAVACYRAMPPGWLVALIALSCYASDYQALAWTGFPFIYMGGVQLIALVGLGFAASRVEPDAVFKALAIGAIGVAGVCIAQSLGYDPVPLAAAGQPVEIRSQGLIAGTLYNSNYVGLYGAAVAPVLITRLRAAPRPVVLVAALATLYMLYLSHSRTGSFGALVGCTVSLLVARRRLMFAVFAIGAAVVLARVGDWTLSGRTEIWRHTLPLVSAFGDGLGSFPVDYQRDYQGQPVINPHSMYLSIAHAFGWVGLAFAVAGLVVAARRLWRRRESAALAGLVGASVAAVANDMYLGVAPIFAVLIGLAYANKRKDIHALYAV